MPSSLYLRVGPAYFRIMTGATPTAPAAPSGLTATAVSSSRIDLAWTDNSSNETGFVLERSANGTTGWASFATPAANATTASDTGLTASTAYYYRVKATNAIGDSAYSGTATATTQSSALPAAPSGLTATAISSSRIDLAWTDNASNETGFVVERSANGSTGWTSVATPAANATTASNTGLAALTAYYYRVKAVNGAGDSAWSGTATASTPAGGSTLPVAPLSFALASPTDRTAAASWTLDGSGPAETGLVLAVSTDDGLTFTEAARIPAGATSCTVPGLHAATLTKARLYTVNGAGMSAGFASASVTTTARVEASIPAAPTGLSLLAASDTVLSLEWLKNDDLETGFDYQLSSNGGSTWPVTGTTEARVCRKSISGLTASTSYLARVRATNNVGSSAWVTSSAASTLATGVVRSPTGRNPRCLWSPQWQAAWEQARADYLANPSAPATRAGKMARNFILNWTNFYGDNGLFAQMLYQITGDTSVQSGSGGLTYPGFALSHAMFFGGQTYHVADASPTAGHFNTDYTAFPAIPEIDVAAGRWPETVDNSIWGFRVQFLTGALAGQYRTVGLRTNSAYGVAYTAATKRIDLLSDFSQAPANGDSFELIPFPTSDGNYIRDKFLMMATRYETLYPWMSTGQRDRYLRMLNWWVDYHHAVDVNTYENGIRAGDTDHITAGYFGAMVVDNLPGNTPGTFPTHVIGQGGLGGCPIGGPDPTGINTAVSGRNAIEWLAEKARGGEWITSSEYNPGDTGYVCWGVEALQQMYGVEHFQRHRGLASGLALNLVHRITPDEVSYMSWGDNEHANQYSGTNTGYGLYLDVNTMQSAHGLHAGFARHDATSGPYLLDLTYDLFDSGIAGNPYPGFYILLDPYQSTSARSGLSKSYWAEGMGTLYLRDAWTSTASLFGVYMHPHTACSDHETSWTGDFQLYRKGAWAVHHPIGYTGQDVNAECVNSMLFAGLSSGAEAMGPVAHDFGPGGSWGYVAGATFGNYYTPETSGKPPTFLHEWTRSLFYLPDTAGHASDTIICHDRTFAANPKQLGGLDQYYPVQHYTGAVAGSSPAAGVFDTDLGFYFSSAWVGYRVTFTSGALTGQSTRVTSGATAADPTKARLSFGIPFGSAPAVGDAFSIDLYQGARGRIEEAVDFKQWIIHAPVNPTVSVAGVTSWNTLDGQKARVSHLLPATFTRRVYDESTPYQPPTIDLTDFPATQLRWNVRIGTSWPTDGTPARDDFLNVVQVCDSGVTLAAPTLVTSASGEAEGCLVPRPGLADSLALFGARAAGRTHHAGYSVTWAAGASSTNVYLFDLSTAKTWTYVLDGGGSTSLAVSSAGVGTLTVSGSGSHTLVLTGT